MRTGYNPYRNQTIENSEYIHQVIIPVFIPNHEGYFRESLAVLQLCLRSLLKTIHNKTFITIVNNGSCDEVKSYLEELFNEGAIHEIIHTNNIGKLNAIAKGLAGTNFELVTIADADVLFLSDWQLETISIFSQLPKAGVVGIVPQFNLHKVDCANILIDNLFSPKLKFLPVKNKQALSVFYESIGWDKSYNHDYLEYTLALQWSPDMTVLVGTGHFVATYKRDVLEKLPQFNPYKMGGYSEGYLDHLPLLKDYWRVTTSDNFAYHIGNSIEQWMLEIRWDGQKTEQVSYNFNRQKPISKIGYWLKIKLPQFVFRKKLLYKIFLKWKKLPSHMIKNY